MDFTNSSSPAALAHLTDTHSLEPTEDAGPNALSAAPIAGLQQLTELATGMANFPQLQQPQLPPFLHLLD